MKNTVLQNAKQIHMIGIKGQGMAALAELLFLEGKRITGSDTAEVFSTDEVLRTRGIRARAFSRKNITRRTDAVVRSSAYGERHAEVAEARKRGIPVMLYRDALAEFFNIKRGILIAGTHGKTTTTALIGRVLEDAGLDPTVLVGATVTAWGRNARAGKGEWMVAEGDEYQEKFLAMKPEITVITSIEYDHPDYFKTKKQYRDVFIKLVSLLPKTGLLVAERSLNHIITKAPCPVAWYGITGKTEGRHMELNKEAALAVARHLGIGRVSAGRTLAAYQGTSRRMEYYTEPSVKTVVIDDYAHHPTEIKTTLAAVRKTYPKRFITAVFQPHTYTRTHALLKDFAGSFADADEVLLLPIYGSARERKKDFPDDLPQQLQKRIAHFGKPVRSMSALHEAVQIGRAHKPIRQKRVFITLGAGNGWEVARDVAHSTLRKQEGNK